MNPPDVVHGDNEPFTLLLARYSEALSAGGDVDPAADPALSPELRQRLQRALSCLRRLQQFSPPTADAVTKIVEQVATRHDDLVCRQMGRFHIVRLLGRGGGGIVFLAYDPDLRREVALKVPHLAALLAPDLQRRFLREARAAAQLDHPNLVPLYEVGEANGVCFFVSAYCRGGSLAGWLAAQTMPVPVRQTAELLAMLADAVQYVHEHGIYHRDIKPGNILLDPQRGGDSGGGKAAVADASGSLERFTPRLTDFGLAKLHEAQTESTCSGAVLGTPLYMAPEQVEGRLRDIGPATDVYGLGAVLYEMLTGQPPFRGATGADTLRQMLAEEPVLPRCLRRDVPSDLQTICLKCLQKEPVRRYAHAAELADDLRRFLTGEPIQARPVGRSERLRKWVRRRPAKAILMVSSFLIALVLVIGWSRLASLEQARHAERAAATSQIVEHQEAVRQTEQRLRQLHYTEDIAQAWRAWEHRQPEHMADPLNKYRLAADSDKIDDLRDFEWYFLSRLARARPRVMRYPADLYCLAFSPDGMMCASGHRDGTIALWDPVSGRQRGTLNRHTLPVRALAYSPEGKYLASASGARENGNLRGELLLWDTQRANVLLSFPTPSGLIRSLAFTPDGKTLATVLQLRSGGGEVSFWEIPSGTQRQVISFPAPAGAASVAFSPDGITAVIGQVHGKISLCDSVTGQILETRPGHQGVIWSMACGHKDGVLVSGGGDGRVRLCSCPPGGSLLAEYRHEEPVWSVALAPDNRSVASISHDMLKVWDRVNHGEQFSCVLHGTERRGKVVAFSPDGKTLAIGSEYGSLWMYDYEVLRAAEALSWLGHREGKEAREAWAVAFSPDGKTLASAGDDHLIRFWDPATGRETAILRGHHSLVTSLAFSPDGKLLASGSFDEKGPVKLWEVASGKALATLNGHNNRVDSVIFSPDGQMLATAGRDRTVRLWDVATRTELLIRLSHTIESLAFSPDGRTLAMTDNSQTVFLWDIKERKIRRMLLPHPPGHVAVAFSPDGKILVTGDREGMVRFFDAATGELRFSARSPDGVNCLAFTPDGKTVASASFDKKVKLWQVLTGRELLTLPAQKDRVRWLAFSADGALLATAGQDGILHIYRADKPRPRP